MNFETSNTDNIRLYLLDGLSDDESRAVEESFFSDDTLFDEVLAIEDELFYEYQQDELKDHDREVFERKFLRTPEDRRRAAFAAALLDATGDPSTERVSAALPVAENSPTVLQSVAAFFNFSGSGLRFGMAAAAILLSIGVIGLFIQNSRIRTDVASIQPQTDTQRRDDEAQLAEKQKEQKEIENQIAGETKNTEANENRIRELETEKTKLESEVNERRRRHDTRNTQPPVRQPTFATLVISPGRFTQSDGVPMNQIRLSAAARWLRLSLRLKNVDEYPAYVVKIIDAATETDILSRSNLRASGKGPGKSLNLSIAAKSLKRADYEAILSGIKRDGEIEEITRYYFSVVR